MRARVETMDDARDERESALVAEVSGEYCEQYFMIDRSKELAYITLQDPAGFSVIFRGLICKRAEAINCFMCTLALST